AVASDPLARSFRRHPEHGDLGFRRQLADLVEEDRSAVSCLETPDPPLHRAGEGSFLVAEQLGCNERGRDGGAIHADECPARTLGVLVNRPGDELLARTRLTKNEDGSVSAGHPRHLSEHAPKRPGRADDLLEHRGVIDFVPEGLVLILHALFGPLPIVDVGSGRVPVKQPSMFIAKRVVLDEQPTVLAVLPAHAPLNGERNPDRKSTRLNSSHGSISYAVFCLKK